MCSMAWQTILLVLIARPLTQGNFGTLGALTEVSHFQFLGIDSGGL